MATLVQHDPIEVKISCLVDHCAISCGPNGQTCDALLTAFLIRCTEGDLSDVVTDHVLGNWHSILFAMNLCRLRAIDVALIAATHCCHIL